MDIEKITKAYMKVRDARAQNTREYEKKDAELKEVMDRLGNELLRWLQNNNLKRAATSLGTVYTETDIKPSVADWDVVYKWIVQNDAFDMMERRIKKAFVKTYMDENEGSLPPGVNVHQELVARVRKT